MRQSVFVTFVRLASKPHWHLRKAVGCFVQRIKLSTPKAPAPFREMTRVISRTQSDILNVLVPFNGDFLRHCLRKAENILQTGKPKVSQIFEECVLHSVLRKY